MVAPTEQELRDAIEALRQIDPANHANAIAFLEEATGVPKKGRSRRSQAEMAKARKRVYDLLLEHGLVTFAMFKSENLIPADSRNASLARDKLIESAAKAHNFKYEKVERKGYKLVGETIPEEYQKLLKMKRIDLARIYKDKSKRKRAYEFLKSRSSHEESHHTAYVFHMKEE